MKNPFKEAQKKYNEAPLGSYLKWRAADEYIAELENALKQVHAEKSEALRRLGLVIRSTNEVAAFAAAAGVNRQGP